MAEAYDEREAANDNPSGHALVSLAQPRGHLGEYVARSMASVARQATGLATFDALTRGGLAPGDMLSVLGPPGAGKSSLATTVLHRLDRAGCLCIYFAADERAEDIIVRLGQLSGLDRHALERGDALGLEERGKLPELCTVRVLSPERHEVRLEDAIADGMRDSKLMGLTFVLVDDSLQTAPCAAAQSAKNELDRIDRQVMVCKAAASAGAIVIALSEMSRDGYRHADPTANALGLASGKGSGSIEYRSNRVLTVRPDNKDPSKLRVELVKNRGGIGLGWFEARVDARTARFEERATQPGPDRAPKINGGKPGERNHYDDLDLMGGAT